MRIGFLFVFVVAALLVVGCGRSGNPVEPDNLPQMLLPAAGETTSPARTNRYLWGLWRVRIDASHCRAEVVPQRAAEMHLNAVRLLEVTPCTDCLRIDNIVGYPPNELTADLTLRHPFPGLLKYTGFDVRGIFISGAGYTFPVSGRSIAWGDDIPRMLNTDGYTALFNPTEFPETHPPALGYIPGKRATGGDLSATLNPFVAYAKDAPRRMFEAGGVETRTVRLWVPDGPLEFGYAVDACWQLVDEVVDPVEDFPPDANCLEAYSTIIQLGVEPDPDGHGDFTVDVEVFDHQGLDTISAVTLEAPDLFEGVAELTFSEVTGDESYLYRGTFKNELAPGSGDLPLLVRVVDTQTDENLGEVDAWHVETVTKRGWARTWGGGRTDRAYGVAVDSGGLTYVTGYFRDSVDFDPGPGVDEHTAAGGGGFLSKFDSTGSFIWALTWGGEGHAQGHDVGLDGFGSLYVAGWYGGTVDFDPGPGTDFHTSNGGYDIFLSKFDSNGSFQWARTWGGTGREYCEGIAIDEIGNICVTGSFENMVDFDPGPGVDEHMSFSYKSSAYLSKFNSNGDFLWAGTWGAAKGDMGNAQSFAVAVDGPGNIYTTGCFRGTVDFDPGPGTEKLTSVGGGDVFLSKFNAEGDFLWVRTWGSGTYLHADAGHAVTVDLSGNVYVTGSFWNTADLDPGPGVEEHESNGYYDVFLSKFTPDGVFLGARTWGGHSSDHSCAVVTDNDGNVLVTGWFNGSADFDPGPGEDIRYTVRGEDAFLSKFSSTGDYLWARTWGGLGGDCGHAVAVDGFGSAYVTGHFWDTVDFDPGPGTEYHTSHGGSDAFLSKFPPDGNWW